ncbi:HEPN domain-containing protein [Burkholderia sp. LA-2-3-30-S1-D2]|uniref:ApeA N-terminal domain 1-containing protein n=1 Tax=Burkholderia sp. LA-2-3-30-S1-D2 TaxID=1637862 RepID=UPI000AFB95B8|nr:HEPN domain-containing protein [Burkholderia sp. LA-2-3-30-S1-D2]
MQTHEQYNGVFLSSDGQFTGLLNISGAESILKIVGKKSFFGHPGTECADIHGLLNDGKKVSLLDCVLHGKTQYRSDENTQFEDIFFPNYVVVGEQFIRSGEPAIKAIRYHFENVSCLLSQHETFQSLMPDANEVHRILEADHNRQEKIAEEYGWPKRPFKPQIGEHPHLLYFSGLWEIMACESKIGKVSLTNRTSHNIGSARGIGISNQVTANIEFSEPKTLSAAIRSLYTLHGLFELSLGQRQRYHWIELELIHRSKASDHDIPQIARLYWSLCNERVESDSKMRLGDVLLAADRRPEEFAKVVTGWMNSSEAMGDPRERFATAFFGSYDINRIVGAANMFDLLPESHAPKVKEADAVLKEATMQCRNIFKDLPDSFSKQSVLSALGRIGKASLRDKVYHRADKVIAAAAGKFPELHLPCNHAVLSRNHYVHGSKGTFDYQEHFTEFAFITDTLEFIFAVSDLLDLGWDFKGWMDEGLSMMHPFGSYVVNYPQNISRLKSLVGK